MLTVFRTPQALPLGANGVGLGLMLPQFGVNLNQAFYINVGPAAATQILNHFRLVAH